MFQCRRRFLERFPWFWKWLGCEWRLLRCPGIHSVLSISNTVARGNCLLVRWWWIVHLRWKKGVTFSSSTAKLVLCTPRLFLRQGRRVSLNFSISTQNFPKLPRSKPEGFGVHQKVCAGSFSRRAYPWIQRKIFLNRLNFFCFCSRALYIFKWL